MEEQVDVNILKLTKINEANNNSDKSGEVTKESKFSNCIISYNIFFSHIFLYLFNLRHSDLKVGTSHLILELLHHTNIYS